ncbi:MAG: hypothetical protein EA001_11755 [Oscillatoriales cyanobacterium]|nr:MAG: hypothetical protein EA001_11755 [Oscillatoriales cyanobacterium]
MFPGGGDRAAVFPSKIFLSKIFLPEIFLPKIFLAISGTESKKLCYYVARAVKAPQFGEMAEWSKAADC